MFPIEPDVQAQLISESQAERRCEAWLEQQLNRADRVRSGIRAVVGRSLIALGRVIADEPGVNRPTAGRPA